MFVYQGVRNVSFSKNFAHVLNELSLNKVKSGHNIFIIHSMFFHSKEIHANSTEYWKVLE